MSTASAKAASARRPRNESPMPKPGVKPEAKVAVKPVEKEEEKPVEKKEDKENYICGLHSDVFKVLVLGPLAVAVIITASVAMAQYSRDHRDGNFFNAGEMVAQHWAKHWAKHGDYGTFLAKNGDMIVVGVMAVCCAPLAIVFAVTMFRATMDLGHFAWWQQALLGALVFGSLATLYSLEGALWTGDAVNYHGLHGVKRRFSKGAGPSIKFEDVDTDKDGKCSIKELHVAIETKRKAETMEMHEDLDKNNDKSVDHKEFEMLNKASSGGGPSFKFEDADTDKDGGLSTKELHVAMGNQTQKTDAEAMKMHEDLDKNNDKSVDQKEFEMLNKASSGGGPPDVEGAPVEPAVAEQMTEEANAADAQASDGNKKDDAAVAKGKDEDKSGKGGGNGKDKGKGKEAKVDARPTSP